MAALSAKPGSRLPGWEFCCSPPDRFVPSGSMLMGSFAHRLLHRFCLVLGDRGYQSESLLFCLPCPLSIVSVPMQKMGDCLNKDERCIL
jgi:hypothetical protein